jgi:uncharacterized protein YcgL (UPF0745 family)
MLGSDVEYYLELSGGFGHFQGPWPFWGSVFQFGDKLYITSGDLGHSEGVSSIFRARPWSGQDPLKPCNCQIYRERSNDQSYVYYVPEFKNTPSEWPGSLKVGKITRQFQIIFLIRAQTFFVSEHLKVPFGQPGSPKWPKLTQKSLKNERTLFNIQNNKAKRQLS